MKLTLYEQETIITYNRADPFAMVYTCDPVEFKRLGKTFEGNADCKRAKYNEEACVGEWQVPKKWVTVRKPIQRNLTDEQRKELATRLQAWRKQKAEN